MKYYIKALTNYANFKGRARRKEFWYFFLPNAVIAWVIPLIMLNILLGQSENFELIVGQYDDVYYQIGLDKDAHNEQALSEDYRELKRLEDENYKVELGFKRNMQHTLFFSVFYSLAFLIPAISVGARRMHDINKSGWFFLIPFYNLSLAFNEGYIGENEYGLDPKQPTGKRIIEEESIYGSVIGGGTNTLDEYAERNSYSGFKVILLNNNSGGIYATLIAPGYYTVGRKSSSKRSSIEIETDDNQMSGDHFTLSISPNHEVVIKDNASANGTDIYNAELNLFLKLRQGEEVILGTAQTIKAGFTELEIKILGKNNAESVTGSKTGFINTLQAESIETNLPSKRQIRKTKRIQSLKVMYWGGVLIFFLMPSLLFMM
jgi:uncharacterized membrane protein YhaH (DUF805 family)